MKNRDVFAPWNNQAYKNDSQAPHNKEPDNPDKCWNKPLWHPEDLTQDERKYYGIDYDYYKHKLKWKKL